jgi:ABC-2 type transport system ATP-binding protein
VRPHHPAGRVPVQLCGDIDALLAEHKVLVGPRKDTAPIERTHKVVQTATTARQSTLFVHLNGPVIDPAYQAEDVTLEELVLAYMGADEASAGKHLTTVGEGS